MLRGQLLFASRKQRFFVYQNSVEVEVMVLTRCDNGKSKRETKLTFMPDTAAKRIENVKSGMKGNTIFRLHILTSVFFS
jgi:hypothetical protein